MTLKITSKSIVTTAIP